MSDIAATSAVTPPQYTPATTAKPTEAKVDAPSVSSEASKDKVTINLKARQLNDISGYVNNFDKSKSLDDMAAGLMNNAGITDKAAINKLASDLRSGRVKDAEGIAKSLDAASKAESSSGSKTTSNGSTSSSVSFNMFGMTFNLDLGSAFSLNNSGANGGINFSVPQSSKASSSSFSSNSVREKMDKLATQSFVDRFNQSAKETIKPSTNANKNFPINEFLTVADL